jgi:hypothetical protein
MHFGIAADYTRALAEVLAEGVPEKRAELLRAHFQAPGHKRTARKLAAAVGCAHLGGDPLRAAARRIDDTNLTGSGLVARSAPEG